MGVLLSLLLLCPIFAGARERHIHFEAEISRGNEFRKDIGSGLTFALTPNDVFDGWMITISPATRQDDPACGDFTWVATPPYRFRSARFLDTSYGVPSEKAVQEPHQFRFVLNCRDYLREYEWVSRLLWSYSYSEKQLQEAGAKLGSSSLGTGNLRILKSRVTPSETPATGNNLGAIDWIRFVVEISLPIR
jgi:hypothetical protein